MTTTKEHTAVQVFDTDSLHPTPAFLGMLRASSCPLLVVLCGTSGTGKSSLGNQLLQGVLGDQDLADYTTPFGVADGTAPRTAGVEVAPPIKLWQLLQRHGCQDLLTKYSTLSGDEDVFVVDTGGLASVMGSQTPTPLIQQLVGVLCCATTCLYVSTARPTVQQVASMSEIIKLCNMDYLHGTPGAAAQLRMCLLLKDVVSVKKDETVAAARARQKSQGEETARALSSTVHGENRDVPDQGVGVVCFPQYSQVDNPKYKAAQPLYWGCLQDVLEQICEHAGHTTWPGGVQAAGRLGEVLNLLQGFKSCFNLTRFEDLRWSLYSHKLGMVVQERIEQQVQHLVEQKSGSQLTSMKQALGSTATAAATAADLLLELDPALVGVYRGEWPDRWVLEAQQYARPYYELLQVGVTKINWWMIGGAVLVSVGAVAERVAPMAADYCVKLVEEKTQSKELAEAAKHVVDKVTRQAGQIVKEKGV